MTHSSSAREHTRHYISATDQDIQDMMNAVGVKDFSDLYKHIPQSLQFNDDFAFPEEFSYEDLQAHLQNVASKNNPCISFLGDELPQYKVHPIVPFVASIRNLTTAYTPYQPERSQGTLITHWIYQCVVAQLTGFEAINTSLYERSTAIFEAICCAIRLHRKASTVLVSRGLFPNDIEVLETLIQETDIKIEYVDLDPEAGCLQPATVQEKAKAIGEDLAALVFTQTNHFGVLENVDALTDIAHELNAKAIAIIDPMLLATGGLKPPNEFGQKGADIIAGEAQHLAIGPNFGGPGLGVFGVRFNDQTKNDVRTTPGRFIGKAKDESGRDCFSMVLSTREQHIRKEKATSNICSNQAFLATLAGAAILARGESGMSEACTEGHKKAHAVAQALISLPGIELAFPGAFYNEFTLKLNTDVKMLISKGSQAGLHVGVDISDRDIKKTNLLKVSFSDIQTEDDIKKLIQFFEKETDGKSSFGSPLPAIMSNLLRTAPVGLSSFTGEELQAYYTQLGELNVSPDDACYPLGSCTMKYNPYINDWAANLDGFTQSHPQAPTEDVQGCLEVLYKIQEWFKQITGLAGVTTQPVAGAQGELVGLKLFQAYHRDRGEKRDVIFIPKSAHGTNFATAVTAGYKERTGIIYLQADTRGQIDKADFDAKIKEFGTRLAGIMVTNPNTSGIFESDFADISQAVHDAGGLVYMDGANMNAIAGWLNLNKMGVDAVHQNLHKTWSIPHGGGGPGDGVVAVSERLIEYLPGHQFLYEEGKYRAIRSPKSIGSFHRHLGNFAHKVRCYTYLLRLGQAGIPRMSAMAVLSARYLWGKLSKIYPTLPKHAEATPRMHEFILTLTEEEFQKLEAAGINKASIIPSVGKLFLDFGFHAPTVAFPEPLGLMIEPTESYAKHELDHFCDAVAAILKMVRDHPEVLKTAPHFTPVDRVDEVSANRQLVLSEPIAILPAFHSNRKPVEMLQSESIERLEEAILEASGSGIGV